jgi:eukaryotic-like serine/threonine-protein kinase
MKAGTRNYLPGGIAVLCLLWIIGPAQAGELPRPASCETAWIHATQGPNFATPVVDERWVYIGSGDGDIHALDATTGKPHWRFSTGAPVDSTPVIAGDRLFFQGRDGYLHALDKHHGEPIWRVASGEPGPVDFWDFTLAAPAVADGKVLLASGDGSMRALAVETGSEYWRFETDGALRGQPLIVGQRVYFGSFDGWFRALDLRTGELLWQFKTVGSTHFPEGAIQGSASHHEGVIYFGSRDYNLYALDAQTGAGRWNQRTPSWVIGAPLVEGDRVYFGTSDSLTLHATHRLTGIPVWERSLRARVFAEPILHDGLVYIGAFNGLFHAIVPEDGQVVRRFETLGSRSNRNRVYDDQDQWQAGFRNKYREGRGMDAEQLILDLGAIASRATVHEDLLIFASSDHHVYALPADCQMHAEAIQSEI